MRTSLFFNIFWKNGLADLYDFLFFIIIKPLSFFFGDFKIACWWFLSFLFKSMQPNHSVSFNNYVSYSVASTRSIKLYFPKFTAKLPELNSRAPKTIFFDTLKDISKTSLICLCFSAGAKSSRSYVLLILSTNPFSSISCLLISS